MMLTLRLGSLLFKKETGVAPGEYREALRLRRAEAMEQPRRVIPYCFISEMTGEKSNIQDAGATRKE